MCSLQLLPITRGILCRVKSLQLAHTEVEYNIARGSFSLFSAIPDIANYVPLHNLKSSLDQRIVVKPNQIEML